MSPEMLIYLISVISNIDLMLNIFSLLLLCWVCLCGFAWISVSTSFDSSDKVPKILSDWKKPLKWAVIFIIISSFIPGKAAMKAMSPGYECKLMGYRK